MPVFLFKNTLIAFILLAFSGLGLAGCPPGAGHSADSKASEKSADTAAGLVKESEDAVTWRLNDGKAVSLDKHPERTIVLLTSLLNLWYEAGGRAIGRCEGRINVPPEAEALPVLGKFSSPNLEKIIALEPDLVIGSDLPAFHAITPILEQNGIQYAYFGYDNFHDYLRIFRLFARLNGTESRYQRMRGRIQQNIDEIRETCVPPEGDKRPRVLVIFSTPKYLLCERADTQTGVMLSILDAKNAISELSLSTDKSRVNVNLERIVQLNPDIILLNTMGDVDKCRQRLKKEFTRNAAWSAVRAIEQENYHVLPKSLFIYKSNHRFAEALEYLAAILYPKRAEAVK